MTEIPEHLLRRAQVVREKGMDQQRGQAEAVNRPAPPPPKTSMPEAPPPSPMQRTVTLYDLTVDQQIRIAAVQSSARFYAGRIVSAGDILLLAGQLERFITGVN